VFVPNPVQDLGNESLTDQKDVDYADLAPAYHTVTLTHLDGSGFLHGDWATIVGSTGNLAYSPGDPTGPRASNASIMEGLSGADV
jgi:hypothetical protein